MRTAIEEAEAAAGAEDWLQVGTANMAFHNALVSLSDSSRLMRSFGNVLAELRLAFLKVEVLDFLHAPFVGRNREVLETYLNDSPRVAAARLGPTSAIPSVRSSEPTPGPGRTERSGSAHRRDC